MWTQRNAKEPVSNSNAILARLSKFLSMSDAQEHSRNGTRDLPKFIGLRSKLTMPKRITEKRAKKQLAKMLQSFTPESILHLLADVHAAQVKKSTSEKSQQLQLVQHTLIVVGVGIDSILTS